MKPKQNEIDLHTASVESLEYLKKMYPTLKYKGTLLDKTVLNEFYDEEIGTTHYFDNSGNQRKHRYVNGTLVRIGSGTINQNQNLTNKTLKLKTVLIQQAELKAKERGMTVGEVIEYWCLQGQQLIAKRGFEERSVYCDKQMTTFEMTETEND